MAFNLGEFYLSNVFNFLRGGLVAVRKMLQFGLVLLDPIEQKSYLSPIFFLISCREEEDFNFGEFCNFASFSMFC